MKSQLRILMAIRFSVAFASFLLMALIALLFLEKPFQFSPTQIAILLTTQALSTYGLEIVASFLLPKIGLRYGLLFGCLIGAIALALIWLFPIFPVCLILILCTGFGIGLVTLTTKLWISKIADEHDRVRIFGLHYRIVNMAAGIAPVLGFGINYIKFIPEIFFLSSLSFLLGFFLTFFFFNDTKKIETSSPKLNFKNLKNNFSQIKNILPYYLLLFFTTYSFFQIYIVPYYLKTFSTIPKHLGIILALNPVLIILFQGKFSKLFYWLEQKSKNFGFIIGLSTFFFSFLIFSFSFSIPLLILFIILITIGEMLIYPNIDFAITQNASAIYHPLLLSLNGFMISTGKAAAEGIGIYTLNRLFILSYEPTLWWISNLCLIFIVIIFLKFFFLYKRKTQPM